MRVFVQAVSLAQLVEQLTLNQWVESSSLSGDTKDICGCLFLCPRAQTSRVLISLCSNDYCVHTISEPLGGHKRHLRMSFFVPEGSNISSSYLALLERLLCTHNFRASRGTQKRKRTSVRVSFFFSFRSHGLVVRTGPARPERRFLSSHGSY